MNTNGKRLAGRPEGGLSLKDVLSPGAVVAARRLGEWLVLPAQTSLSICSAEPFGSESWFRANP